jgi:hypothetical protein
VLARLDRDAGVLGEGAAEPPAVVEDRGERHAQLVGDLLQRVAGGAQLQHPPVPGRQHGQPGGEVDGGEDPADGVVAPHLGEADAGRLVSLLLDAVPLAVVVLLLVEVGEAQHLDAAGEVVAEVENVAQRLAVALDNVPAQIDRPQLAGVHQQRVVEDLAAQGAVSVEPPGQAERLLHALLADVLVQVALDGLEDAGLDLVLEGAADGGQVGRRHGILHAARTRWPTAHATR